ncbi:hypothetical protein PISMIDRAFT_117106 [Pisolithus microcarpus 441]|uniref:DDE-1 domain-containing protein n=1 Tax=Pisolithus microcarpus 441 TaxID=765257 RepID=A0A0C9YCC1_9AGAM|nr:hypothetical protein PISMIDRAFT_117106 [Pisolithus microcarpus 441]
MLKEKRQRLETLFGVPEEERLNGDGWLMPICRTYKIQEHRQHGKAGSVNLDKVEAEWHHCQAILSKFAPQDCWNFDETSLFPL